MVRRFGVVLATTLVVVLVMSQCTSACCCLNRLINCCGYRSCCYRICCEPCCCQPVCCQPSCCQPSCCEAAAPSCCQSAATGSVSVDVTVTPPANQPPEPAQGPRSSPPTAAVPTPAAKIDLKPEIKYGAGKDGPDRNARRAASARQGERRPNSARHAEADYGPSPDGPDTDSSRATVPAPTPPRTAPAPEPPKDNPFGHNDVKSLRMWTDISGKYHAEARFVSFQDGTVRLQKASGGYVRIEYDLLSATDKDFVLNQGQGLLAGQ